MRGGLVLVVVRWRQTRPGRPQPTNAALLVLRTRCRLRRTVPEVVAIKEAAGSVDQVSEIAAACDIPILSGDDGLTLPMMAVGAVGVVSVLSNLHPKPLIELVDAANAGDYTTARKLHFALLPLFKTLFIETNPVPVKRAMQLAGAIPCAGVRLPLVELSSDSDAKLAAVLEAAGLVKKASA